MKSPWNTNKLPHYLDKLYAPFKHPIERSMFATENEIYGELYYYSVVKLLKYLKITSSDHFLDIGSGLGKLVFQVFLTTEAASVTGIEINAQRHNIAYSIMEAMQKEPDRLKILQGDFLKENFDFSHITIAYVCSTIFSHELLEAVGNKINVMPNVKQVASLRKLPALKNFKLTKKIFLHGSWDQAPCYLYTRIVCT